MIKKSLAVLALAALAVFAGPMAAHAQADPYVPSGNIAVSGTAAAGSPSVVAFAAGSFVGDEDVLFAVNGEGTPTLSAISANTRTEITKSAENGAVSVTVTPPAGATGTYTITATGLESNRIGLATITIASADAGAADGLAATGYDANMLLVWGGAGALLLGIALMFVLRTTRRQRSNA